MTGHKQFLPAKAIIFISGDQQDIGGSANSSTAGK